MAPPVASRGHEMIRAFGLLMALAGLAVVAVQVAPSLEVAPGIARPLALFTAGSILMIAAAVIRVGATGASLAPSALPFLYIALGLILSTLASAAGAFGNLFLPSTLITSRLLLIEFLFIFGLWASIMLLASERSVEERVRQRGVSEANLVARQIAVVLLASLAGYRVYTLATHGVWSWNRIQGSAQGSANTIEILATLTPTIALMLLLVDHTPRKFVIGKVPASLFAIASIAGLLQGSRDDVIGPALILLWAIHYRVRPVSPAAMFAAILVGFALMATIGSVRSAQPSSDEGSVLRSVASPTNTTALVAREVPLRSPFLYGDTYLDSLVNTISSSRTDDLSNLSAALRFPSLIGYSGRSGLGFSAPAEAYWNFGLAGSLIIPAVYGAALSWAYRASRAWPTNPLHLLYPLLLSRVPIGFRSDFLQQTKSLLLILLAVSFVWAVGRMLNRDSDAVSRNVALAQGNTNG